jgi:hypothetical protein
MSHQMCACPRPAGGGGKGGGIRARQPHTSFGRCRGCRNRRRARSLTLPRVRGRVGGRVVRHLDRFGIGLEAVERRRRPKGLLFGDDQVGRHVGQHPRLEEGAAEYERLPPATFLAPFLTAWAMCTSTFSTAFMPSCRSMARSRHPDPTHRRPSWHQKLR